MSDVTISGSGATMIHQERLYCPVHGQHEGVMYVRTREADGSWGEKRWCVHCINDFYDRTGVHQMSDKAPTQIKKW